MSAEHNMNIDMESIEQRLMDADIPGHYSAFTDEEAAFLGAFEEDAIAEEDAFAASFHNPGLIEEVERDLRHG